MIYIFTSISVLNHFIEYVHSTFSEINNIPFLLMIEKKMNIKNKLVTYIKEYLISDPEFKSTTEWAENEAKELIVKCARIGDISEFVL